MLSRGPLGVPLELLNFDAWNRAIGLISTRGQRWQRHTRWWIGVVDRVDRKPYRLRLGPIYSPRLYFQVKP